ncbi:hypothetical protein ERJ75_001413400 [Trypanosoma vivax]|nr:hypothetical protein ERJ75_001413400 [Trypanosoma vivax]
MTQQYHCDGRLELELVRSNGQPVTSCPIDVGELLRKQGRAVKVGDGVHVRLEEYDENQALYSSGEDEESEEYDEDVLNDVLSSVVDELYECHGSPEKRDIFHLDQEDSGVAVSPGKWKKDSAIEKSKGPCLQERARLLSLVAIFGHRLLPLVIRSAPTSGLKRCR